MLTRIACCATLACAALSASADLPVKLLNNSGNDFADSDIYVAIIGKEGDRSIYYDLAETARQKRGVFRTLDESVNSLSLPGAQWGYANVFTRLSEIQDAMVYLGNTHACRMFFSFKSPMYLHAFADGGYTGADMNNPSDPNAPVRWEIIEFTYEPNFDYGTGQIWINTTRVDAFQYPMGLELYSRGDIAGSTSYIRRGEYISYNDVIARWNSSYANSIYRDCYSDPITNDDLGGIIKQPSKVESVKKSNIFASYIDKIWNYYRTNKANISMGVLGRWEGQVQGNTFVLTCVDGSYWKVGDVARVEYPSTEDAIEGAGAFASGNAIDLTVQAMFCAAFNRGQFRTTTANQSWDPASGVRPFEGGAEFPCNEYVKFFHDTAVSVSNGYTYAFAYDDTFDQSATCYSTGPQSATITIGGFVNGGGTGNGNTPQPEQPSGIAAAPAPTRNAADVISFYSGAYQSAAPAMVFGAWGQSTQCSKEACGGDEAYRFSDFNYLGLQVSADNALVDVSGMQYIHVDLYAPQEMDINFYPISLFPTADSAKASRHLTAGQWNSFDFALSDFPGVDFSKLGQFKIDGGNGQTFYLDNLYFWKESASTPQTGAAPRPNKDAANVMSLYSAAYASAAPGLIFGSWGQATQFGTEAFNGDEAYRFSDFNYLGLQVSGNNDLLNASAMEFIHLDLFAYEDMDINFYPISLFPTADTDKATLHLTGGRWNSFDLPVKDFPRVDFSKFGQVKFDGGYGQTFYLDNLYLWKSAVAASTVTGRAAAEGSFAADYTITCRALADGRVQITAAFAGEYAGFAGPWLHNITNGFQEIGMTPTADGKYETTLSGYRTGDVIRFRVKIAYMGGLGVTADMEYTVGGTCVRKEAAAGIGEATLAGVSVYPNPVNDSFTLTLPEAAAVQAWSTAGIKVMDEMLDGSSSVDASAWPAGMYIMHVESLSGSAIIKIFKK